MSKRTRGISTWKTFSILALVFVAMLFGMLYGIGFFKNWGKRALSEEADRALYAATGRLLAGDLADQSETFPDHAAGRSAREIYEMLRADTLAKPKIDRAYEFLQRLAKPDPMLVAMPLESAQIHVQTLRNIHEARQQLAARLVLRLKAMAPESDRLTRQYRKIAQAFVDQEAMSRDPRDKRLPPDESDNLFGGPNRILEVRIEFGEAVVSLYELKRRNPSEFVVVGGKIALKDGKSEVATSYRSTIAKIERLGNLSKFYVRRLASAVDAERRGLKRSLGL